MPFFTAAHLMEALSYLPERTHPSLVSFLAMLKAKVPVAPIPSQVFGSPQETALLKAYFHPDGGSAERPWYVPFGPAKEGGTNWKPKEYAGKSLQRMRTGKGFVYVQGSGASNDLWALNPDLLNVLAQRGSEVVGSIPLSIHHLAAWCYREENVASHQSAVARFIEEFNLASYNLLGPVFDQTLAPKLTASALAQTRMQPGQIASLLQPLPSAPTTPALSASDGKASLADYDDDETSKTWEVDPAEVRDALGELRGMEEAAFRALAALRAGMHVIFTGPPGTGKTQLARRLCAATGIPFSMVAATDQWTTVDTIGGYFPSAKSAGQLEFLPGFVVNAILRKQALIIDEINRADIDKAFGELFTLLSGNDVELPYLMRRESEGAEGGGRRIRLAASEKDDGPDIETIRLPQWWRLIGSMNDADKASLKRLSYAFVRRFAFVPVSIPPPAIYRDLLDAGAGSGQNSLGVLRPDYLAHLKELFADPIGLTSIDMAMGYAIPEAMMRQARSELALDPSRTTADILLSTLDLYVSPQFQGRADKDEGLRALVAKYLGDSAAREFAKRLSIWTGFVE